MIKLRLKIFSRALVGHLEGATIAGVHHKSEVIPLVERISKVIITIKPDGRKASDIEAVLNQWTLEKPTNQSFISTVSNRRNRIFRKTFMRFFD